MVVFPDILSCFLFDGLAYFCLLVSFIVAISRRFVIRARVGDDILDFCGLLIALATLDALCWIMYVVVSLMVPMLSCSCSVSNRFPNSSWNLVFFDHILVASTYGGLLVINVFLFTSTSSLLSFITSLWSLAQSTKVSPLSFLNPSQNLPVAVSIGFVLFPI